MPRALIHFFLIGGVIGLTACANMNTISRTTSLETGTNQGKAVHLDIQQRLMIINEFGHYCSEPSPDALAAYAAAIGIGASTPTSGAASAAGSGQSSAASVGLRTQSITLMRDALFRMCEAYANGAVGPAQVATLLGRSQDLTAVVLAVEQLTGAVSANQAALTGTTAAESSASVVANQQLLETAIADEQRKQQRLEEAQADLTGAKAERDAAERALQEARNRRDAVIADDNATTSQRKEAEDDVTFQEQKRTRAQLAVDSAQTRVESRQRALDTAQRTRETIEANQDAAVATASAATTTSGQFSTTGQRNVLDKQATEAIAKSVQAMVQTVLAKDYTEDSCMAMITYLPRDFKDWSPDQKSHLKRVQDLCAKFITKTITTRITTKFRADESSDRIDAWLRTSGNRQRLRNWLKTQTPKINVFTLLQGDFRDLRVRAIKRFQIP